MNDGIVRICNMRFILAFLYFISLFYHTDNVSKIFIETKN